MSGLLNEFDRDKLAKWFIFNKKCFYCGEYQNKLGHGIDAFHHIMKRSSNSILNACPIHNEICHLGNGTIHQFDTRVMLLGRTMFYLINQGYKLTAKDEQFISDNTQYYNAVLAGDNSRWQV